MKTANRTTHHTVHAGTTADAIADALVDNLHHIQGKKHARHASRHDWYVALAYAIRARILTPFVDTLDITAGDHGPVKIVAYLSPEFLTGPQLGINLVNLNLWAAADDAVSRAGQDLRHLIDYEGEPGLGNSGLGRVAADYMDSLATLGIAAIGYGIRYEYGVFDQAIRGGWQIELTNKWLRFGNPWEIVRPELTYDVPFGGKTESYTDGRDRQRVRWIPGQVVKGVAYDTRVTGFRSAVVNTLRLWKAEAADSFDLDAFRGDYYRAVERKVELETISKVLYPSDVPDAGNRLRLMQQHFFTSCSLQDMIRIHLRRGKRLEELDSCWAAQLNDTHPSLAVAELMRLLMDEHGMDWEKSWAITQRTCAYTSHMLHPDALERWPVELFGTVLPRHLEIIREINHRFLDEARRRFGSDEALLGRASIVDETGERAIRMAHLACVGSHAINGVSAPHTELLKRTVLADFNRIAPERFINVSNGVTPRRWMVLSNAKLSALLTRYLGEAWVLQLDDALARIEPLAADAGFQIEWSDAKAENKQRLETYVRQRCDIQIDPHSLFDVHLKRFHEQRRQHLAILHVITAYNRLRLGRAPNAVPRTIIFGGKAAPGDRMAKLIIRLIHGVAAVVNNDRHVDGLLKIVFMPDFNVALEQLVYPAADLSEQIATAGAGPSGAGSVKLTLNGALTIGTLDGANLEIRDAVGPEHFFSFGLTAADIARVRAAGYQPRRIYESSPALHEALDQIASGFYSEGDRDVFAPLVDALLERDDCMVMADYQAYVDCQGRVSDIWRDPRNWARLSILNVARAGRFSSDRSIREYARDVWHVKPLPVMFARGRK